MAAESAVPRSEWIRTVAGTVRARATAGAVLVVGVTLLVGGFALVTGLRGTLVADRLELAESRADEVLFGWILAPDDPVTLPPSTEDEIVQAFDESGRLLASTHGVGADPIRLAPGEWSEIQVPYGDEREFVAVAVGADLPDGDLTVVAALGIADVREATDALSFLLAIGLPGLLLVVAFTTWTVVGRALAPVDSIRREVDGISGRELHRRVPEPETRDEIARLASTMNRMLDRLEAAQVRQRRFVSDAAHELRSPVATIRQHAEVALAHPDRQSIGDLAGTVLAEDLRVQRLVEDLLLLARADEGTLAGAREEVDLDDIVLAEARRLRGSTSLRVDSSAVSGGRVRGDPTWLGRMVANLADNAARHARSRVAFDLAERDGVVVLGVDDDGSGVPAADRTRIFERFVRLDEARSRDDGGSGLGLAIVAEVVAAHRGTAIATDSAQGGARFEVRLPGAAG